MIENNPKADSGGQSELNEFMNETEKTAVRTLIHDTVQSPETDRNRTIDSVFSVLSHPGRRYILTYLLRAEGYVTMSELVDYVINRTDNAKSDEQFRKKVTTELTHKHLPVLDEKGFITYNMERQLIQPTAKTRLTAPYLKVALLQQERLTEVEE